MDPGGYCPETPQQDNLDAEREGIRVAGIFVLMPSMT
jgi:hypothetical protein